MAAETGAGDQNLVGACKSLEMRSGCDGKSFYIQLESKLSTLEEFSKLLPMRQDFPELLNEASLNYMPKTEYDAQGSSYRKFSGDYGRIRHVMRIPDGSDIKYFSRVHVVDLLLADGWQPLGFSAFPVGPGVESAELVETWIKRDKH